MGPAEQGSHTQLPKMEGSGNTMANSLLLAGIEEHLNMTERQATQQSLSSHFLFFIPQPVT